MILPETAKRLDLDSPDARRAGIYALVNRVNREAYVGRGFRMRARFRDHFRNLENGEENHLFQAAYETWGAENLEPFVLEYAPEFESPKALLEWLIEREQWYFDNRACEYNVNRNADGPGFAGQHHTEESRDQMSEMKRGELNPAFGRTGKASHMYGKTGKATPMYGKHHTPEARKRIGEAAKRQHAAYRAAGVTATGQPLSQKPREVRQRARRAKPKYHEKRKARRAEPKHREKRKARRAKPERREKRRTSRNKPERREKKRIRVRGRRAKKRAARRAAADQPKEKDNGQPS